MIQQKVARSQRYRKRFQVRFGKNPDASATGFTTNISACGLGVVTSRPQPSGSSVVLELQLSPTERCEVQGVVVWSKKGLSQMSTQGVMGIELRRADEKYFAYLMQLFSGTETLAA